MKVGLTNLMLFSLWMQGLGSLHADARDYFVSPSGNDSNPGTRAASWRSIDKVNRWGFSGGDRILFEAGQRFAGTVTLDAEDSGTADHPVVVTSYGQGRAIIDGGHASGLRASACNHLKIRNLNFHGDGRKAGNTEDGICIVDGQGLEIDQVEISGFRNNGLSADGVRNARITNVYVHENGSAGISIGYHRRSHDVYIGHCIAKNNPGDPSNLKNHSGNGIVMANVQDGLIEYCEAAHNGWDMPWQGNGPVGIWMWNCDRTIIQHCISHDNKSPADDGGGFDIDGGTTNSILQYNLSYNNQGPGYFLCQFPSAGPLKNNIIRYNISHNDGSKTNRRSSIDVFAANAHASGCEIYSNTIYNERGAAVGFGGLPIPGVVFRNNIFMCAGDVISGNAQRGRFENNIYWSANGQALSFDGHDTLEAWAQATGQETVSGRVAGRYLDPQVIAAQGPLPTDPTKLGEMLAYRLEPDSPCTTAGASLAQNGLCDFWGRPAPAPVRQRLLFDFDWRFHRGDLEGGELETRDHTEWRQLDLLHDWSLEDLPGTQSPFDPCAISAVDGGFTTGGTAWYRKAFTPSTAWRGKRVELQFEGIYMNADVWLNGQHLGHHPYGYTSFQYDVTDHLHFDEQNVLAVRVRNEGVNSRWYSGSGMYRHVWLTVSDPVHVTTWGTYITTPRVDASSARINIRTKVSNQTAQSRRLTVTTRLLDAVGIEVAEVESAQDIAKGASVQFSQHTEVTSPSLWSPDSPTLYAARIEVREGKTLRDQVEIPFGIRTISFDVKRGFLLNGKSTLLKGGCVHHDNGPLGAAAFDRAEEWRVALLKASGYNTIRCAHNPPSEAFLDTCDQLGMLVIDEAFDMWAEPAKPQDYHLYFNDWWQRDLDSMVLRDRNHPSIIMWSIGNEIPNMDDPRTARTARRLADYVRKLDPTRPVTAAVNSLSDKKDPFFAPLDVCGYNYAPNHYDLDHQRMPARIMYGSESYPLEACQYWLAVQDRPWVIGDFVWTAFDYLGEASIGWRGYMQEKDFYPWNIAYCGDIDICGWKRPQSFYRDVLWTEAPQVHLFVHPPEPSFPLNPKRETWSKWHFDDVLADWTWPGHQGRTFKVDVYSSCDEVELFLNGQSLGRQVTDRQTQFRAQFDVPYEAGGLRAIGYRHGNPVAETGLSTAGMPKRIQLCADRPRIKADGQDLSYITVELVDARGLRHPKAETKLTFEIQGPGSIAAVANANPVSTESYQRSQRKAWRGRCLVIIRADRHAGNIVLRATAPGLEPGQVTVTTRL